MIDIYEYIVSPDAEVSCSLYDSYKEEDMDEGEAKEIDEYLDGKSGLAYLRTSLSLDELTQSGVIDLVKERLGAEIELCKRRERIKLRKEILNKLTDDLVADHMTEEEIENYLSDKETSYLLVYNSNEFNKMFSSDKEIVLLMQGNPARCHGAQIYPK